MQRRAFLRTSAAAMAVAPLPLLSRRASASDVVEYTLTAAPLTLSPAPNVSFAALAYNGSIPGPVLRASRGQRVRIRYVSAVEPPTSVHWHGMILPNAMDGVAGITQLAVRQGGEFLYEFAPDPPGTRWYHDHAFALTMIRGLFGMFVIEDPNDERADKEFALVFHDVPDWSTVEAAARGVSNAGMDDPEGSREMTEMMHGGKMNDEVTYIARCINGASYPRTHKLAVKVGDRVRLRVLNANPTQTRYVRMAGHDLTVTHADGNRLAAPVTVEALRIGTGERYDAVFEVRTPGAFLLQGLTSDPLAQQQAAVIYTEGMENATPMRVAPSLEGVRTFSYEVAGGRAATAPEPARGPVFDLTLAGGTWGSPRWTINGKTWPETGKLMVNRGDLVTVRFVNTSDMDHPMHLHGHAFSLVEAGGVQLARPLRKDVSLVPANNGTSTWQFAADSPPGRWLLHCHNEIHMADGMMTEVVYE